MFLTGDLFNFRTVSCWKSSRGYITAMNFSLDGDGGNKKITKLYFNSLY